MTGSSGTPDAEAERERLPYIQVDTDLWIVMREDKHRPRAIIRRVPNLDGSENYLLMTWQSDPAARKLVSIHPSLEDANRRVKWRVPATTTPSMPAYMRNPAQTAHSVDSR